MTGGISPPLPSISSLPAFPPSIIRLSFSLSSWGQRQQALTFYSNRAATLLQQVVREHVDFHRGHRAELAAAKLLLDGLKVSTFQAEHS